MGVETKYLCAKEVAKILGVSVRSAQRLMRAGELKCFLVGRRSPRTDHAQIGKYVARQFARYRPKPS